MNNPVKDITIIGGGPAGLYASFYAGMRELDVQIIECEDKLGGMIHYYPEKLIWDIGALTPITGSRLIRQMVEQGLTFDPEVILNEKIIEVKKIDGGLFQLVAESGEIYTSKYIIIATGAGIYKAQKLNIAGEENYYKTNLHYAVYELEKFRDKNVLIVGGGSSAVDWVNELEPYAKTISLVHRSDHFKAFESSVSKMKNSSATILTHFKVTELISDSTNKKIEAVTIQHMDTKVEEQLYVDEIIVNIGIDNVPNFYNTQADLGLEMLTDWVMKGTPTTETGVEGIYAAGDIIDFTGKVKLISGAFTDAANAVNEIKRKMDPKADKKAKVSSHNELFEEKNKVIRDQNHC